jgi:virginiamycin A acetyltransferase
MSTLPKRVIEFSIGLMVFPLAAVIRSVPPGPARNLRFQSCSEALSLVPFQLGILARRIFYQRTLQSCGANLVTRLGVVFVYPDASVGSNVFIGRGTNVGLVDIGDDVMVSHRVSLLSGRHHHGTADPAIPMREQEGQIERIRIGSGAWIGADATIMTDVGTGAVVGAGSVVVHPVAANAVVAGNPAHVLRTRPISSGSP